MTASEDYDADQKTRRPRSPRSPPRSGSIRSPAKYARRSTGKGVLTYVNRQASVFYVLVGVIVLNLYILSSGEAATGEFDNVSVRSGLEYYRKDSLAAGKRMKRRLTPLENQAPITIITRLVGDATDWLQYVAKSRAVQLRLKERGIPSVIRYQVKQKNDQDATVNTITKCFPKLKVDFAAHSKLSKTGSGSADYQHRRLLEAPQNRRRLFGKNSPKKLLRFKKSATQSAVAAKPSFGHLMEDRKAWLTEATNGTGIFFPDIEPQMSSTEEEQMFDALYASLSKKPSLVIESHNISVPFLVLSAKASPRDYNDYYNELRALLEYDDGKCCGTFEPPSDKTVVYYAGRKERSILDYSFGSTPVSREPQDLTVTKLKKEVLKDTEGGIAILSPNADNIVMEKHMEVIRHIAVEGRSVSVMEQDLCYLRSVRKELVGFGHASMVHIAAFLSKYEPKVRLYSVRETLQDGEPTFFQFSAKALEERFTSESYQSEGLDLMQKDLMAKVV